MKRKYFFHLVMLALWGASIAHAAIDPSLQAKVDKELVAAKELAAHPAIVAAARRFDDSPSFEALMMTQEQWAELASNDQALRAFVDAPACDALRAGKSAAAIGVFVSGSSGAKIAFTQKPEQWSDQGLPRFEKPLSGQAWQGESRSNGTPVVEIAVPVMLGYKPIGVLVVQLNPAKLR